VGVAGGGGETGQGKGGGMAGAEDGAIRNTNSKAGACRMFVGVGTVDSDVVAGATGVGNDQGVWTRRGGDYR
jgi:hypothetical protein